MNSLKQSAYYAIGILMMKGVSLIMIPYITHKLSLAEYGSLEALVLLADIGTILFSFGIVDAMYRYIGTAEGTEKRQLISNCFTLSVIVCIVGASLLVCPSPGWFTCCQSPSKATKFYYCSFQPCSMAQYPFL